MKPHADRDRGLDISHRSPVYRELMAERQKILEHKWLESEKAGQDIGYEKALFSWVRHHRTHWLKRRRAQLFSGS